MSSHVGQICSTYPEMKAEKNAWDKLVASINDKLKHMRKGTAYTKRSEQGKYFVLITDVLKKHESVPDKTNKMTFTPSKD